MRKAFICEKVITMVYDLIRQSNHWILPSSLENKDYKILGSSDICICIICVHQNMNSKSQPTGHVCIFDKHEECNTHVQ